MTRSPLRIGVAELRRRPGNQQQVQRVVEVGGVAVSTAEVPEDAEVVVEVTLESLTDGVRARGVVRVPWEGACRRCLGPTGGVIEMPVDEVYKDQPDEGETLPVEGDSIDLGPVVHDATVLALPLAPLCGPDCAGPDPEQFPVRTPGPVDGVADGEDEAAERPIDPRWAALEQLRFDSGGDE